MKIIKIISGNDFTLYVPLVLMTSKGAVAINPDKVTDLLAVVSGCGESYMMTPSLVSSRVALQLAPTLDAGVYSIEISGKYDGRAWRWKAEGKLEIVSNNAQSNFTDFISQDCVADTQIVILGNIEPCPADVARESTAFAIESSIASAKTAAEDAKTAAEGVASDASAAKIAAETASANALSAKTAAESIVIPTDYATRDSVSALTDKVNVIDATVNAINQNMFKGIPISIIEGTTASASPNMRYFISESCEVTLINDPTAISEEYMFVIQTPGDSDFELTLKSETFDFVWSGGEPTWERGALYEVSGLVVDTVVLLVYAKYNL